MLDSEVGIKTRNQADFPVDLCGISGGFRDQAKRLVERIIVGCLVKPETQGPSDSEFDLGVRRLRWVLQEAAAMVGDFEDDIEFAKAEVPDQLPENRTRTLNQLPPGLAGLLFGRSDLPDE